MLAVTVAGVTVIFSIMVPTVAIAAIVASVIAPIVLQIFVFMPVIVVTAAFSQSIIHLFGLSRNLPAMLRLKVATPFWDFSKEML